MKNRTNGRADRPVLIETLESRRLLSATTAVKIASSLKTPEFGQSFTLTATVTSPGKKVTKGFVELYVNKAYTGFREVVNKQGVASFSIGSGNALDLGTQAITAHYVVNTTFAASTSKHINVTVGSPTKTFTADDGLRTAVITPGKGPAVVKGDTITFENTGYTSTGQEVTETAIFKPPTDSFKVGATPLQTVAGLDQAVVGMRVGEVLDVYIPATLAYNNGTNYLLVVQLVSIKA